MPGMESKREQKRQAILQAAQQTFLSAGYLRAKMDEIAAEAGVTKQTVYRYYSSKEALFRATLAHMGEARETDFARHLQQDDTRRALTDFAVEFIRAHLSPQHVATFRLLVSENAQAPELTSSFFDVGPDDTHAQLKRFFEQRLNFSDNDTAVDLWTAALLGHRSHVLAGLAPPTQAQIEHYAQESVAFLLSANGG